MAEVQAIEALYYPQVEFPSAAWAKAALLYWEGLMRIVPDGHTPNDPPEVKALVDAGAIKDVSPAPFRSATTEVFGTRLEDLLQSRKGEPIEDDWSCVAPRKNGEHGENGQNGESVHLTQMDRPLLKSLESKKLATVAGQWAHMSAPVARLFQIAMANEASGHLMAAPITETNMGNVASTYFSARKVARDPQSVPTDGLQWAQLYTPFPSVEAVAPLKVEKLLDLRTKHAHQRRAFRDSVQRRTEAMATLPSPEAIRSHLEEMADEMKKELEEQQEALRAAGVREAWTLLGVSSPLSIGTGTALLSGPTPAAAIGAFGAVGLGVVDWYVQRQKQNRTEGHYLLSVGHDVDHSKMVADFGDRLQRLVHGSAHA
jgi:hypothetical protein